MNYLQIENFLTNLSFGLLFFSMLFFWFQAILIKSQKFLFFGQFLIFTSNLTIGCFLLFRWFESKHFPSSNLYESLMFLSWGLTLVFFIIERIIKDNEILNAQFPAGGLIFNQSVLKKNEMLEDCASEAKRNPLDCAKHNPTEWRSTNGPKQSSFYSNYAKRNTPNPAFLYSNIQEFKLNTKKIDLGDRTSFDQLLKNSQVSDNCVQATENININSMKSKNLILLGSVLTPIALLTNAFASFTLPPELRQISPLVPALQSNWLMMHVTVMMLSYTALISGCLFAIVFLIITKGQETPIAFDRTKFDPPSEISLMGNSSTNALEPGIKNAQSEHQKKHPIDCVKRNPTAFSNERSQICPIERNDIPQNENLAGGLRFTQSAKTLDNLSYRTLSLGFSFLTIGILSGAVWANEAWGSYWSWDPKETWALITWIVFAIYLHTRLNRGWQGKNSALIAVFGLIIVCICYLGVNFLGKGLHSYGFFE